MCGCGEWLDCTVTRRQVGIGASSLAFCWRDFPIPEEELPFCLFQLRNICPSVCGWTLGIEDSGGGKFLSYKKDIHLALIFLIV